jgi:endonuclease/exonuclease/phosphatase family metal-dependent hydrolase
VLLRGLGDRTGNRLGVPLVLMGDLNMGRGAAERVTGLSPLVTGRTFPAHAPTMQIDHLLTSDRGLRATGGPVRLPMSDHCALVAELS